VSKLEGKDATHCSLHRGVKATVFMPDATII